MAKDKDKIEFSVREDENRHDSILRWFMDSEKSPSGEWYREVPVGIKKRVENQVKKEGALNDLDYDTLMGLYSPCAEQVDAVCVRGKFNLLPMRDRTTGVRTSKKEVPSLGEFIRAWRDARNSDLSFDGESVVLVEAKGRRKSQSVEEILEEGVSQLDEYKEYFLEDWDAEVEDIILVAEGISTKEAKDSYPDVVFFSTEEMSWLGSSGS